MADMITLAAALLATLNTASQPVDLPVITVTADDTVISTSCIVEIDPESVIADANNNGVIHINAGADNIIVQFKQDSLLRGALRYTPGDQLAGVGIRINGAAGVTLRNLKVEGYKVGLHASNADRLTLERSRFNDNFRQRLQSTSVSEDQADWLYPHDADNDEWMNKWGAAVYIRDANDITIRDVTVRDTQNGVLINRVNNSRIYDNDASFLSGWGLGMFRSSRNIVTRNAFDFCVRGHVEGVYNRGQDSAGIICFEQCSNNVFAENSATHGGDGFFSFAGREALGERGPADYDATRKGCNDNLFIDNDFSYAPAHGLELTFSFGNKVIRNRFVENGICGVWGGYSQEFLIAENQFEGNGGMAYGLERGGVNIEHGAGNRILKNTFINNRCGVHFWWDPHNDFEQKPWGRINYKGVVNNVVAANTFTINASIPFKNLRAADKIIDLHLRDDDSGAHVTGTVVTANTTNHSIPQAVAVVASPGVVIQEKSSDLSYEVPPYEVLGNKSPVGARPELRGRDKIVMTEWGPWDHRSPMLRARTRAGAEHVYELFGADPRIDRENATPGIDINIAEGHDGVPLTIRISSPNPGVHPYRVPMLFAGRDQPLEGLLINFKWTLTAFTWDDTTDPRTDLPAWRALAASEKAVATTVSSIRLPYGGNGPRDLAIFPEELRERAPGADRFGVIATATFPLPKGKWRIRTLSDDGVRVTINSELLIDNWDWHAPERDEAVFDHLADSDVAIVVEHFEIDGHAVLEFDIEPVKQ